MAQAQQLLVGHAAYCETVKSLLVTVAAYGVSVPGNVFSLFPESVLALRRGRKETNHRDQCLWAIVLAKTEAAAATRLFFFSFFFPSHICASRAIVFDTERDV